MTVWAEVARQQTENAELRAEIERLTAERDDAVADYLRRHNDVGNMMEDVIKLRAEIERLQTRYDSATDQAVRYADEIERLTAALQQIEALPAVDGLDPFEANRRGQEFRLNEQGREIARRALENKP